MPRDVIDDRLIGSLHVRALTRAGFAHDPAREATAFQIGTLDALLAGRYDGEVSVGELLAHGDLGVGTVQALGGELVVVDGEAFVVDGDAVVHAVDAATPTPFAVVTRFQPVDAVAQTAPLTLEALRARIDELVPDAADLVAIRVDGTFRNLRLRSVARQRPPYPPLVEVTAHQREWAVAAAHGSVVGFRFPDATAGLEVPGFHLHFLASDHSTGGHVLDLCLDAGRILLDGADELHVALAADVGLGRPGAADRAAIAQAEGGGPAATASPHPG